MSKGVRIEGLDRLVRKVLNLKELPRTKKAVRKAGEIVQKELREYPPERHGPAYLSRDRDKRRRQLRAIFALRAEGRIPYQRTRALARGWKFDYRSVRSDMTARISNDVRYAHWVQSDSRQVMYHRVTGWRTAGTILEQMSARAVDVVFESIDETIKRD